MSELERVTIDSWHQAYQSGELDPTEGVDKALRWALHIERQAPSLEAFVSLDAPEVRAQAEASAARWAAGEPRGPLDGVPVAIKDEFHVAGYPTAAGTTFLGHTTHPRDCPIVARLREAGAVILGKTSMHEIGLGGSGVNPRALTARNPYDARYMAGGSSSGSAVAVSAGVVPVALGSDAGGSIRIPAAFCGLYGIKPTYGRVPTSGGELLSRTLDHTGPLGASLQDLAVFLDVTAGADAEDHASQLAPAHEPIGRLEPAAPDRLRLAWCPGYLEGADEDVLERFHEALDALREAGAHVEAVALPHHRLIQPIGYVTLSAEGAASQRDHLRDHRAAYALPTRMLLAIGERITTSEYMHAQRARALVRDDFEQVLFAQGFDALVSPTTGCVAQPITVEALEYGSVDPGFNARVSQFTFAGNLTGLPCVTVPAGAGEGGMPVGFQLMGRPWEEAELLARAAAVDELTTPMARPRHWRDVLREGV